MTSESAPHGDSPPAHPPAQRPAPNLVPPDLAAIFTTPPARASRLPEPPAVAPLEFVELTVDDQPVAVPAGSTVLQACRSIDVALPTLCYADNLSPVNVCRLCVVEISGSRALAPACSRQVEPGMVVGTETPRVRAARKGVLELLASSVDLGLAGPTRPDGSIHAWLEQYGADAGRFGPPAGDAERGDPHVVAAGRELATPSIGAARTVAQPVKIDNDLYVRDYARCILCYKCVEACGDDAQNTFAIAVAGRGFGAHISTEHDVALPDSACVFCGNCIGVCPTGALMFRSEHEMRVAGSWDEARQEITETICGYCGVGCSLELHVQDNRIVKVTSPADSSVTGGHLCIKGRFGFEFVHLRDG